jgi:hypothetical protein
MTFFVRDVELSFSSYPLRLIPAVLNDYIAFLSGC